MAETSLGKPGARTGDTIHHVVRILTASVSVALTISSMDSQTKERLAVLKELIQKEKDPKELLELVNEVLRIFDETEHRMQREKPN